MQLRHPNPGTDSCRFPLLQPSCHFCLQVGLKLFLNSGLFKNGSSGFLDTKVYADRHHAKFRPTINPCKSMTANFWFSEVTDVARKSSERIDHPPQSPCGNSMEQSATRPPLHAVTLTNILKPSSQRRAPISRAKKTRSTPSPRSFIGYGHQWLSSSMGLSLNCSRSIISTNKLTSVVQ